MPNEMTNVPKAKAPANTAAKPAVEPEALRQVVTWILAGHSEPDVLDAIAAKWPNRDCRPLIIEALRQIAKAGEPDPDLVRGFAIEATRGLYCKCLEVGDHATALRALKQLNDLAKG